MITNKVYDLYEKASHLWDAYSDSRVVIVQCGEEEESRHLFAIPHDWSVVSVEFIFQLETLLRSGTRVAFWGPLQSCAKLI